MKIFIDTEFSDFISTELISIGAVTEDGREFYAELTDYNKTLNSGFVNEHIVPLLGQNIPGAVYATGHEVAIKFGNWIEDLVEPVTICIDYMTDWDLAVGLLEDAWPANLSGPPINVYADLTAKIIVRCVSRDTNYVVNGEVVPEGVVPQSEAIRKFRNIFNGAFDEHFLRMQQVKDNYKQHHALFDARANLAGYQSVLNYINSL